LAQKQMRGGGTVFSFELTSKEAAFRFANALKIVKISNNLGDAKSIITHPATTTHQRLSLEARLDMGIPEGLLRFSVGLEDVEDLIDDVNRGLAAV
jgi:O-succinylhomoserine sulfhydrylase